MPGGSRYDPNEHPIGNPGRALVGRNGRRLAAEAAGAVPGSGIIGSIALSELARRGMAAPAKMFEVMASGGILITNAPLDADAVNYGLFELFPADSLITFDHVCGSDLIEKVDRIIKDEGFRNYTVKNALKAITGNHTHEIRINQIINTIKKEFNI